MSSRNAHRKRKKRGKTPSPSSCEFWRRVDALVAEESKIGDISTPIRACATAVSLNPREREKSLWRVYERKWKGLARYKVNNYYIQSHLDGVLVRGGPSGPTGPGGNLVITGGEP